MVWLDTTAREAELMAYGFVLAKQSVLTRRLSYYRVQKVWTLGADSMWDWFARWKERQRELQNGVDADLVRENRKRWKHSMVMFVCFFLLIGVQKQVHFPEPWSRIVLALTMIFFIGGLLLARWAGAQDDFLSRPNPKDPPSFWNWRR